MERSAYHLAAKCARWFVAPATTCFDLSCLIPASIALIGTTDLACQGQSQPLHYLMYQSASLFILFLKVDVPLRLVNHVHRVD